MQEQVQRWASILLGAAVVILVGWMTYEQTVHPRRPSNPISAEADAGALAADAEAPLALDTESDAGTPVFDLLLGDDDAGPSTLPSGAPKTVKIGVVLVQWKGAEGAATSTRSKQDALALAQRLAGEAKGDFRRAVSAGDPGSSEDIGRIPRGVLDPRTEAAVFSLGPKDVSDVLETPRGYWIVKRIE